MVKTILTFGFNSVPYSVAALRSNGLIFCCGSESLSVDCCCNITISVGLFCGANGKWILFIAAIAAAALH
ncbi:unnamed protein product [Rhizophagus irregularis]|nr:unnamed protein product [Rhizophagus irregularis]